MRQVACRVPTFRKRKRYCDVAFPLTSHCQSRRSKSVRGIERGSQNRFLGLDLRGGTWTDSGTSIVE